MVKAQAWGPACWRADIRPCASAIQSRAPRVIARSLCSGGGRRPGSPCRLNPGRERATSGFLPRPACRLRSPRMPHPSISAGLRAATASTNVRRVDQKQPDPRGHDVTRHHRRRPLRRNHPCSPRPVPARRRSAQPRRGRPGGRAARLCFAARGAWSVRLRQLDPACAHDAWCQSDAFGLRPRQRLDARNQRRTTRLHWHPLRDTPSAGCVSVVDALIHAVRCQSPRHAIATLDSAIHHGLIGIERLPEVFAALPRRFQVLRGFLDARAQSGPETLVRLMALSLGFRVDLQVEFDGVGFVDLVLDGWLVVECDSRSSTPRGNSS